MSNHYQSPSIIQTLPTLSITIILNNQTNPQTNQSHSLTHLGKFGHGWVCLTTPPNSSNLRWYFFLITISLQKIWDIDCFLPEILMVKQSSNLFGEEHILVNNLKFCKKNWRKNLHLKKPCSEWKINWSVIPNYF